MKSTVKKVWNIVTTVLVTLVVLIAIALVGVRLVGIQAYVVLSGSMEPEYPTGSLLYVRSVDTNELEVGDVITFMIDDKGTLATHRIIEILPDEEDPTVLRFRTKGDNNDIEDGTPVHYLNVVGTPVFNIPKLGYVANFIQNPPGMYIAIGAAVILLILVFMPDMFKEEDEKNKKAKAEPEPESESTPVPDDSSAPDDGENKQG